MTAGILTDIALPHRDAVFYAGIAEIEGELDLIVDQCGDLCPLETSWSGVKVCTFISFPAKEP